MLCMFGINETLFPFIAGYRIEKKTQHFSFLLNSQKIIKIPPKHPKVSQIRKTRRINSKFTELRLDRRRNRAASIDW